MGNPRGRSRSATPKRTTRDADRTCDTCAADLEFLLTDERPDYERGERPIMVIDLFSEVED